MAVDVDALDAFLASDGEVAPANEATEEAVESQIPETAPEPETETSIPEGDTFDRKYVEQLRRESAGYRERAKRYQAAFDGYEDEQVEAWLGLARQLRDDPRATAAEMQALVDQINSQFEADLEQGEADQDRNESEFLSRSDVERMFQEREQQAEMARRVAQIEADARDLGYEVGSEDYEELLWVASRSTDGSIIGAHEKIQARNQAIYDRMIAKVAERGAPRVPAGTSPELNGSERRKTFAEANEALEAWLATQG